MANKSKEKKNTKPDPNTLPTENSGDIFKTLFGDSPEDASAASIFSDANPFRRKAEEDFRPTPNKKKQLGLGFEDLSGEKKPKFGALCIENDYSGELNNRKRKKDKRGISDAESIEEEVEDSKKLKKYVNSKRVKEKRGGLGLKTEEMLLEEGLRIPHPVLDSEKISKEIGVKSADKGLEMQRVVEQGDKNCGDSGAANGGIEKKKKKRKRDEIEMEYEKKLYVAVGDLNNEDGGVVVGEKRKKMENPQELMVSKEGFDDEDKLLRTVFVGNLPLKIKKKVLIKEFGRFGEVESVRIRSIPLVDSKVPRKGAIMKKQINENADSVHAYIVFKTVESAQGSLAHNMAVVGGNHIRVDRACPPRKKLKGNTASLYDNKRTVFVGNLPFDVKDEELYQLFTHIKDLETSVEAVRVVRDPNSGLGKGIAYVLLKSREAANLVVRKRDVKLRDRELRLSHAKSNSPARNSKNISPGNGVFPSKRVSQDSRTPGSNKADMSYQGLRASKSGVSKKAYSKTSQHVNLNVKNKKAQEPIDRKRKRPAVAARKAKALKSDSAFDRGGTKRKLGNHTPDSVRQKKKARKYQ